MDDLNYMAASEGLLAGVRRSKDRASDSVFGLGLARAIAAGAAGGLGDTSRTPLLRGLQSGLAAGAAGLDDVASLPRAEYGRAMARESGYEEVAATFAELRGAMQRRQEEMLRNFGTPSQRAAMAAQEERWKDSDAVHAAIAARLVTINDPLHRAIALTRMFTGG